MKFEGRREAGRNNELKLHQCRECKVLFLDRAAAIRHAQRKHLDLFFAAEDIETEPPSGNFTSVARCGLSGILLGPPNHHSFNQKLAELHAERYAHLSLDEYRKRVETIRDPALIEQWKQETRRRRVYKEKGQEPPAAPVDRAAAEAKFLERYADPLVLETARVIVPGPATLAIEDADLKQQLRLAWNQESRRAFTITISLRPALRHMRFHSFRANGDNIFVTAIEPQPLNPRQAVKPIRKLLNFLKDNPGCNRQQLIEGLRPGAAPESEQVAELIGSLRWLKEKGHIIEFYDGTLAVPRSSVPPKEETPPAS